MQNPTPRSVAPQPELPAPYLHDLVSDEGLVEERGGQGVPLVGVVFCFYDIVRRGAVDLQQLQEPPVWGFYLRGEERTFFRRVSYLFYASTSFQVHSGCHGKFGWPGFKPQDGSFTSLLEKILYNASHFFKDRIYRIYLFFILPSQIRWGAKCCFYPYYYSRKR